MVIGTVVVVDCAVGVVGTGGAVVVAAVAAADDSAAAREGNNCCRRVGFVAQDDSSWNTDDSRSLLQMRTRNRKTTRKMTTMHWAAFRYYDYYSPGGSWQTARDRCSETVAAGKKWRALWGCSASPSPGFGRK